MKKFLCAALAVLMVLSVLPMSVFASDFDAAVTGDYFKVISEETYTLAPGATETELVVNNAEGNDRKVVHYFEVDTKNENIEVMPGYYRIDKLDPDNLKLDGVADKTQYWKAEQLTKTVAYYEGMGYNVVGAMNTALAYDSDAPYGYMVWQGVVLGGPEVHKGAQTYLAIDREGNCELRSMSTPLNGTEYTAIPANFGWLVKDGELVSKTVERTSSDASRSMIGIKADGTLVFCQVDGRNAPFSSGLSNYEMGEMMLAIGCVNAVNCDGGGSSTFVSKREGETVNTMRSVPSDGSERATINSVVLVSKAKATGEFDHAVLDSEYDYIAPGATVTVSAKGVDAAGSPAEVPEEGITWAVDGEGTVSGGKFTAGSAKGDVTVQMLYNGEVVGTKTLKVVDPDVFALTLDETVLPYGKEMTIDFACTYGADSWGVCVDGAYSLTLSDESAATLNGNVLKASSDESVKGVNVTATYLPSPEVTDVLKVEYGKGSEIIYDFEDGELSGFVGFDEAKAYSAENGISNTLVGDDPLAGQFSEQVDSWTTVATKENGQVRNGEYALAWHVDNTDAGFSGWTYNVIFNIGETIVLRDTANGLNATTLGMWLYIPEGATGLAFQSQLYAKNDNGTYTCKQDHFMFETVSGVRKNLNSCTEADIPESRWVYATVDISKYDYICTPVVSDSSNSRSPSFIRTYIKPMLPAIHTFYIDDITLDYSSAVDDRVLPKITDVSYTTADESVALANDATISGNNVAFSAVVSDNIKLDGESGKIYVDGVALDSVAVSGKYLASESVTLTSGKHTVVFEIKDALGNPARVIRNFTITGDSVITLDGHNDSGALAEYGSVYYADVKVADITDINKLTVALRLQNANTWEPEGLTVAEGFDATYTLDSVANVLTVTVERNDDDVDEDATTLISAPIRLWVWDAIDHVTGLAVTPEVQYKTGNCPVVTIDCRVTNGEVEFAGDEYKNTLGVFGGSFVVDTMINDIVNPWHCHDEELTTLNKAATCVSGGYENRTYCETCKSVIDWGTATDAAGHNFVDGVCTGCGKENTVTGLVEENGNWYYYVSGKPVTGWQMIGTDWYYFDETTAIGAEGDTELASVTFNFENGRLTSGVWVPTLFGTRYYYGPGYYNDRGSWRVIDGKNYYFEKGVRLEGGWQLLFENQINRNWYYFNEDGTCDKSVKPEDGFYTDRNGYAYAKDGQGLLGEQVIDGKYYHFDLKGYAENNGTYVGRLYKDEYSAFTGFMEKDGTLLYYTNGKTAAYGLHEIDGDYYFINWGGVVMADGKYYVGSTNCDLNAGTYTFGADGKALNGIVEKDGVRYLYKNGLTTTYGLYEIKGDYYFADWGGVLKADGRYYVGTTFCDLPAGNYTFGADGTMLNGIEEIDGTLYLYKNGTTETYGLYKIDGDYYYVYWGGVIRTDDKYYVSTSFCDLPAGNYEFGADGKMLNGIVDIGGTKFLYFNGVTATKGLYKIDGEYYYSFWGGEIRTNGKYFVDTTFCDLPASHYTFDENGKMLDGIVERDGELYLYQNGITSTCGLFEVDGAYYYAYWGGLIKTDGRYFVSTTYCDLPASNYTFGKDGKMLDGIVDIDGTLYLYENGTTVTKGLFEIDGEYYFADWGGVLKTGGKYFVDRTFCDIGNGNYEFDENGKMLNGIVEKDGVLYLYINGVTATNGLYKIGDDYYYSDWGGVLKTGGRYYVGRTFCDLRPSNYTFDENGKMLNGFVTIDGVKYYYVNGNTPSPGIIKVDGDYYFVSWSGVVIVNQRFFAWEGNGYTIPMNYLADENGKIIG
ncbi:MAG: hypothetical protein E7598_01265 [Ruminococcaceae bacterium]|nr:hypothetical protein [Oscillospiraceae bacterium]